MDVKTIFAVVALVLIAPLGMPVFSQKDLVKDYCSRDHHLNKDGSRVWELSLSPCVFLYEAFKTEKE